ncbi:hypothetical protein SALBM311S_09472 [Streptomyces alboniger]
MCFDQGPHTFSTKAARILVLVAKQVRRIPLGRPLRQSPSSSATQAPARTSPSGATAGLQVDAGTFKAAWWMASVMVMPTE